MTEETTEMTVKETEIMPTDEIALTIVTGKQIGRAHV